MPYLPLHVGRSFADTRLEDVCPCPKEPCGLVSEAVESCDQHALMACKTLRQGHLPADCPGRKP